MKSESLMKKKIWKEPNRSNSLGSDGDSDSQEYPQVAGPVE